MANRFKKMIQPLLDEARREGYKAGHEKGLKDGFQEKTLAYENEIKFLKVLVERLTGRSQPRKTNSDVIRSMSDKELAGFLAGKFTGFSTEKKLENGEIPTATQISAEADMWYRVWMQWLWTPVEDGNNGKEQQVSSGTGGQVHTEAQRDRQDRSGDRC